jgi:hypothetical protein
MSVYWNHIDRHFEKATALLASGDDDDLSSVAALLMARTQKHAIKARTARTAGRSQWNREPQDAGPVPH